MRVFFMGTPQLAVPVLKRIIDSEHEVVLVVSQPDKRSGRQQKIGAPPIKLLALEEGIPFVQPVTLKDEQFRTQIEELQPDIGVVFAYGKIIPQWLIDIPKYGIINIHASLLPRWRGAAPIQRAIMEGDTVTGVTIMQLVQELDAGDILLQQAIDIEPQDTAETLALRMSIIGANLLIEAFARMESGTIQPKKQNPAEVTYAQKIEDEDLEISWTEPAETIFNQIRGLNPKPGAHTHIDDTLLKIWWVAKTPEVVPDIAGAAPGMIIHTDKRTGPYIATGTEPLLLAEVQPANKKKISGAEFMRGYRLKAGDRLGTAVHSQGLGD